MTELSNQNKDPKNIQEELANLGDTPSDSAPAQLPLEQLEEVLKVPEADLTPEQREAIAGNIDNISDEDKARYPSITGVKPSEAAPETPVEPEPTDETTTDEPATDEPAEAEPVTEDTKPAEQLPEKKEQTVEDRYKESTRESQILSTKNRKYEETVLQAAELPEPSDQEMSDAYPDWELMTDLEKSLAKKATINDKRFAVIHQTVLEGKKVDDWAVKVDQFIEDSADPDLKGHETEFRSFSMKESRRGIDLPDLQKIFLYDVKPSPKKNSSLLMTGGGGEAPKDRGLDADDLATLRTTDHKAYARAIKEGKAQIKL